MKPNDELIRSRSHPLIKRMRAAARGRDDGGLVLAVGERLVRDAVRCGIEVESILVREDVAGELHGEFAPSAAVECRAATRAAMEAIGALTQVPGVLALIEPPAARGAAELEAFVGALDGPALVLGVHGVADPGNLGALARCAEAAGASAIVVAGDGARPFGTKALRGSMGTLLRLPVFQVEAPGAAMEGLDRAGFAQLAARTRGGAPLGSLPIDPRTAVWVSSETGEEPAEFARCVGVTIPMGGAVESLNVSVAGALLLYEFTRVHGT